MHNFYYVSYSYRISVFGFRLAIGVCYHWKLILGNCFTFSLTVGVMLNVDHNTVKIIVSLKITGSNCKDHLEFCHRGE